MLGAGVTVKHAVHVPLAVPLVTVTSLVPGVALPATLTLTISVELDASLGSSVVELTMMPVLENVTTDDDLKFVPLRTTFVAGEPTARWLGVTDETDGLAPTLKQPLQTAEPPSTLVTVMSRGPGVAPDATATPFSVMVLASFTTGGPVKVTPVPLNVTVGGPDAGGDGWKPVPLSVIVFPVSAGLSEFGLA